MQSETAAEDRATQPVAWEVRVLGPLEVVVDGVTRPFPAGRPGRLVAELLLAGGRVVSAAGLVDAVWPDDPPADPRAALHTTVRRARQALGPAASRLVRRGHGYALDRGGLRLDADELAGTAARPDASPADVDAALALWRGDPWDWLADDLAATEAARLRACRRRLHESRARALLGAGHGAEAAAALQALLTEDPLAEGPVALLVEALDLEGDVAGALTVLDEHRRRLADELGLDPSPRLVDLQQRVLRRDTGAATGPPPLSAPPEPAPSPPAGARPVPPRTLHGRETQLRAVGRLLAPGRCVTLVGPGGVGKTSLAARVAQDADSAARAVRWVDLTRVGPGEDPLPAVAEAVGAVVAEGSLLSATLQALGRDVGLLVLDNCEHTAPRAADLVEHVLREAPGVALLATSRERLDLDGEQVLPLAPLQLPSRDVPADDLDAVDAVRSSPAVAMFLERAEAAAPGAVGPADLPVVADVVWRLDGLPLAIGLAAGRVGSLTLVDLRDRLEAHLDDLRTASRRAHPRQRTLAATIDWSHDLLGPEEQHVFAALSVFSSGFELADVDAVLGREAVPVVGDLVQRSLVAGAGRSPGGAGRFVLLETLRAYAAERLAADPDRRAAVEAAHGRWAVDLAQRIDAGTGSAEESSWAETARRRLPDLAAAYRRALEPAGRAGAEVRTVARTVAVSLQRWAYYRVRPDVLAWSVALLDGTDDAALLATAATHAWMTGETALGLDRADRALAAGRGSGELRWAACAAGVRGDLLLGAGRLEESLAAYSESAALAAEAGQRFDELVGTSGQLLALAWLGRPWRDHADRVEAERHGAAAPSARAMAAYCLGEAWAGTDPVRARSLLDEALHEAEASGCVLVAGVARTAATALAARTGTLDGAGAETLARTLEDWLASGNENLLLTSLRNAVPALGGLGRHRAATELLAALDGRRGSWGDEAAALDAARATARDALGAVGFAAAWEAGAARPLRAAAEAAVRALRS